MTEIENVAVGTIVWAMNPDTGEVALKKVVRTFVNETDELVHVKVSGEEIICTPSHPFYSPVKGWTKAVDLRAGDILVRLNGTYIIVEQVQHELLETPVRVYNFEVADFHTYFVGKEPVLVHNKCILEKSGVKVEVRSREDPRHVPHAHVSGNGPQTTIGLDMQPMKRHAMLSNKQLTVIKSNWEEIRGTILKFYPKFR